MQGGAVLNSSIFNLFRVFVQTVSSSNYNMYTVFIINEFPYENWATLIAIIVAPTLIATIEIFTNPNL